MDLIAEVDASIFVGVEDGFPAFRQLLERRFDQSGRTLRPRIKKRPGECAGERHAGVKAESTRRLCAKKQLLEVITGTLFDSPVYRNYGSALVEERFKPAGFAAPLGLKDMRLVGQSAESLRVPMPVLNVLRDHLLQTIAAEGEEVDWSAIGRTVAKNGGL